MATKALLMARLSLDKSLFEKGIVGATASARGMATAFASVSEIGGLALGKITAALAALGGVAGFAHAVDGVYRLGHELFDLSQMTGVSAGMLSIWRQAAKDAGADAELIGVSINRMQRNLLTKTAFKKGEFVAEFEAIKKLSPERQFFAIGEMLRKIEDPAKRAQIAIEVFGRSGGKLLPLLLDPTWMEEAARALGKQAEILNAEAAQFREVSVKLSHIGVVLRGFFVGVASGLAEKILPILSKIEGIDLTSMGKEVGDILAKSLQAIVGFIADPHLIAGALGAGVQAAVMEMSNLLIAVFGASVQFFKDGMLAALEGIGGIILSTLIEAFAKPIAYFQAGIEKAIAAVSSGGAADIAFQRFNLQFLENLKKNSADPNKGGGMVGKATFAMFGGDEAIRKQQAVLDASIAAQKLLAPSQQTVGQRAQEILDTGGPRAGIFGEAETPAQMRQRSSAKLMEAMNIAGNALKTFAVRDVMGAGPKIQEAFAYVQIALEKGGDALKDIMEGVHPHAKLGPTDMFPNQLPTVEKPGDPSSVFRVGARWFSGLTAQPIFGKKSALNRSEQDEFIKSLGLPVGHQTLKEAKKEAEKREIEKRLKADAVAEKQVVLTERIAKATEETAAEFTGE